MVESVKSVEDDDKNFFFLLLKLKAAGGSRTFEYGTEGKGTGQWRRTLVSLRKCYFLF